MPATKVSILMRTKERPQLLKRAMQAVLKQTFTDWHLVIINDGGEPSSVTHIAESFALPQRLTVLHQTHSKGMAAASNCGIANSESEYIALLDDDDTWEPTFLQETVAVLDAKGPSSSTKGVVTYTNAVKETLCGDQIVHHSKKAYPLQPSHISFSNLLLENQFTNLSFLYRRQAFATIGMYDEELPFFDDWDFNLRFALRYEIALLPRFLANYHFRVNTNALGASSENSLGLKAERELYLARFRDRQLRLDVETGRLGIGTMMHLSYQHLKAIPAKQSLLRALKHDFSWAWNKLTAKFARAKP